MLRLATLVLCALTGVGPAGAASPVVYDANGVPLGIWIQAQGGEAQTLLSSKGYCFALVPRLGNFVYPSCFLLGGAPNALLYESEDCTGPSFAFTSSTARGGSVAPALSLGETLYYTPKGEFPQLRSMKSKRTSINNCEAESPTAQMTISMLRNDPEVTGVLEAFAMPVDVKFEERCVFANGFECPKP